MDYALTKVGFPPQEKMQEEVRGVISFPLSGRAPKGFFVKKFEFGAEVVCKNPPTVIRGTRMIPRTVLPYVDASDFSVLRAKQSCRRRAFRLANLTGLKVFGRRRFRTFPQTVLYGEGVALSVFVTEKPISLQKPIRLRHADADTLCFVHSGSGKVATDFGLLYFEESDFIFLPRGVTYSFDSPEPFVVLMYEFTARLMRPHHHWIDGYPFPSSAVIPARPLSRHEDVDGYYSVEYTDPPNNWRNRWPVYVKRHGGPWVVLDHPFSPYDAVAWEGELYPFVLHLRDIRTLESPQFHLDPKARTIFVTEDDRASIQVFLPSWKHSLPYNHQPYVNEVLFNHRGYSARPEISDGVATLHPPGVFHGPAVDVLAKQLTQDGLSPEQLPWRNEVAVMLETSSSLVVLPVAERVEIFGYEQSWWRQWEELNKKEASR